MGPEWGAWLIYRAPALQRVAPVPGPESTQPFVCLQMPVTFEDVAVRFSAEEWEILEGWQKALHKDVMEKNYQLLISLGKEQHGSHVCMQGLALQLQMCVFQALSTINQVQDLGLNFSPAKLVFGGLYR